MTIPISQARQKAFDRLTYVLQQKLGEEITPLTIPATLPLPIPDATGYYLVGDSDEALANRQQAIFIYDTSSREVIEQFSGGPTTRGAITRFNVNIIMIFKVAMCEPITKDGKAMTRDDVLRLRAERYTGAITNTIYKYACSGDDIHDVALLDDQATATSPDDKHIIGLAATRWSISQKVTIPQRTHAI